MTESTIKVMFGISIIVVGLAVRGWKPRHGRLIIALGFGLIVGHYVSELLNAIP